jgi:hypothetical protein
MQVSTRSTVQPLLLRPQTSGNDYDASISLRVKTKHQVHAYPVQLPQLTPHHSQHNLQPQLTAAAAAAASAASP